MSEDKDLELLRRLAAAGDAANMWEAGAAMGLDRSATETLAIDLFAKQAMEVANLSGKVRITATGRSLLGEAPASEPGLAGLVRDLAALEPGLPGNDATDLAADLACLQAQAGRSRPLMPVVRACLAAVETALAKSKAPQAAALIKRAATLREQA
ncbi:MAG: hypothetical protein V1797_09730 [Pseudomonadota bacterium]